MEKWKTSKEGQFHFGYERFDGSFFACGNIGYDTLIVDGIGPDMRKALTKAYESFALGHVPLFREDKGSAGKPVLTQVNSVVALIYHKSYDLKWGLGLKFNEHWAAQSGHHYAGFLSSARAVVEDWQWATTVPPLAVREKLDPEAHLAAGYEVARTMDDALHIRSDEVQIVLVGFADQSSPAQQRCLNLQAIFDREPGASYTVVTKDEVREFYFDEDQGLKEELAGEPER